MKKILLLGSGELGKEFVISAQRKGQYIIACDSYAGAPAMQVADECEVFSMLDGDALERVVRKHVVLLILEHYIILHKILPIASVITPTNLAANGDATVPDFIANK